MSRNLAYILFAFAFVVAIVVGLNPKEPERVPAAAVRARVLEKFRKIREAPAPADTLRKPERSPSSETNRKPATEMPMNADPLPRDAILRKYGDSLRMTEHESRVVRIDGTAIRAEDLQPNQKEAGFRASSSAALVSRAREILSDTRQALGIPAETQFLEPAVNPGEHSGQVVFQQAIDGVPVSPGGLVTILLGSDGELRTLDSSIHPSIRVLNVRAGAAPAHAREILFVTQSSPSAEARYAYETRDGGIQKVVDVQTQEVLLERDRRIR